MMEMENRLPHNRIFESNGVCHSHETREEGNGNYMTEHKLQSIDSVSLQELKYNRRKTMKTDKLTGESDWEEGNALN